MPDKPLPHILFFFPDFNAGGAQRVLISYANGLGAAFRTTVLSANDGGPLQNLVSPGVALETLKVKKVSLSLPALWMYLRRNRPDAIVCTMAHVNLPVLLLKPFFPHTAFIVREANMPQVVLKNAGPLRPIYRILYRLLYPKADAVVVPARYISQQLKQVTGVSQDNHVVAYNPVDTAFINRKLEGAALDTDPATVNFVAVGRLHWQKGFERLIEALSAYQSPIPWRLDIIGDGEERGALEALIAEHGLDGSVFLQGFQENPWIFCARADCFLLSSRGEGLPNVVLESLACGTPVIAMYEAGGIAEIKNACDDGVVQIAGSMDEFVQKMKKITKKDVETRRNLLPAIFKTESAVGLFADIIRKNI